MISSQRLRRNGLPVEFQRLPVSPFLLARLLATGVRTVTQLERATDNELLQLGLVPQEIEALRRALGGGGPEAA